MKIATSPGFNVTLRVNDTDLQEYDDNNNVAQDDYLRDVKYVEAVSGANFSFRFSVNFAELGGHEDDRISVTVYLDGKQADNKILPGRREAHVPLSVWDMKGVQLVTNDGNILQRFTFATLQTTDCSAGPSKRLNASDFTHLGEIEVRCVFVRTGEAKPRKADLHGSFIAELDKAIPEKCLKGRALSKRVSLGEPERLYHTLYTVHADYPYGKTPFGTYVFKYRSRRDLQIEDIIPRSPSPVPLEERDPEDLTLDEARELLRRKRAAEGQVNVKQEYATKIKKEKRDHATYVEDEDDDDEDGEVEITGENHKRARLSDDSAVDIIDLTDD